MRPTRPRPEAYRSPTPWAGFTPREKKRAAPLPRCPSPACRRAKACIRAIDGLYCRRTHCTVEEQRYVRHGRAGPGAAAALSLLPPLPPQANFAEAEAYRIACEMLLAQVEEQNAAQRARWKAGALDHLYGPYDPRGALMLPPARDYVEAPLRSPGPWKNRAPGGGAPAGCRAGRAGSPAG